MKFGKLRKLVIKKKIKRYQSLMFYCLYTKGSNDDYDGFHEEINKLQLRLEQLGKLYE